MGATAEYTAVITGGSKDIGAEGVEEIEDDLTDPAAVARVAADIGARHQVTHLVHNAGIIRPNLVEDLQVPTQLHLGAALQLLQAFLPAMKARGFGRALFNAPRAALGTKSRTAYSATKAGMIGMARTWALELAPHGITVNVVTPGPILTDTFWGIVPKGSAQETDLAAHLPVGRLGTSADVTRALLVFADLEAGFITS